MSTAARLLRAGVRVDRAQLQFARGARYALGVGAPLLAGVAAGRLVEGVAVSVGALLVGLTDSGGPYRRRVGAMLAACAGVALSTFVGELVGADDVAAVVVLAAWSFAAGLWIAGGVPIYLVALMGPLAMVAATSVPTDATHALARAALVLAGGLLEVALVLIAWGADRTHPERAAVAAVYRALADWVAGDRSVDDRAPIFLAVAHARDVLGPNPAPRADAAPSATGDGAGRALRELVRLADLTYGELVALRTARAGRAAADGDGEGDGDGDGDSDGDGDGDGGTDEGRADAASDAIAEALTTVADSLRPRRPRSERRDAARERLEAALGSRSTSIPPEPTPVRRAAAALARWLGEALALATDRPVGAIRDGRAGIRRRRLRAIVAANLTPGSSAFRHALRLTITVVAAMVLARALELPHGYWAPLTALWLLRPEFGSTFTRGLQRYAGTAFGAIAATVLAATAHPGPYALAAAATVLAAGIYAFMWSNYALTAICTTGWVVFVSALAGIPELRAAADRLLDTTIGAALTLGVYLLWPTWERAGVPVAVADVIEADRGYTAAVLGSWLHDGQGDDRAIGRLRDDSRVTRTNAEAELRRAFDEPAGSPTALDPTIAIELLAQMRRFTDGPVWLEAQLHDGPRPNEPNARALAGAIDRALSELADATRDGAQPIDVTPVSDATTLARALAPADPLAAAADRMCGALADAAGALARRAPAAASAPASPSAPAAPAAPAG